MLYSVHMDGAIMPPIRGSPTLQVSTFAISTLISWSLMRHRDRPAIIEPRPDIVRLTWRPPLYTLSSHMKTWAQPIPVFSTPKLTPELLLRLSHTHSLPSCSPFLMIYPAGREPHISPFSTISLRTPQHPPTNLNHTHPQRFPPFIFYCP